MNKEVIISKYAKALSVYAYETGALDKVLKSYQDTKALLWDKIDIRAYFLFPGIDKREKLDILAKCKEHLDLEQGFFRFICLLLEEDRFNLFLAVYEKFRGFYEEYNKKVHVKITSAYPLSVEEEKDISAVLEKMLKRRLVIEKAVDKTLLGGMDIFLVNEDLKINLSLKSRLERLKKEVLL